MHGPYHLKAMIDQRHEEALREAQTRRLAKQARGIPQVQGVSRVVHAWRNLLPLLWRAEPS
jgi:hypothetical protein